MNKTMPCGFYTITQRFVAKDKVEEYCKKGTTVTQGQDGKMVEDVKEAVYQIPIMTYFLWSCFATLSFLKLSERRYPYS